MLARSDVKLPYPAFTQPDLLRCVVRNVGDRTARVRDANTHGATTGVRNLPSAHVEPFDLELGYVVGFEAPTSAKETRRDRKARRRHRACQQRLGLDPLLGNEHANVGIRMVAGGKEREAHHVVPVQMGEHDRAPEGSIPEDIGEDAEPSPCIEYQPGRLAVVRERNTRRVSPGLGELCSR